jgi:hypothetical protein
MPELISLEKNSARASARRTTLASHSGKCTICHHPERAEIERAFLDWTPPYTIMRDFQILSRNAIYRHAHAFGLFDRRQRSLRMALDRLIEKVDDVKPTAASIISAIALMAKLNEKEKLTEESSIAAEEDSQSDSLPEGEARPPKPARVGRRREESRRSLSPPRHSEESRAKSRNDEESLRNGGEAPQKNPKESVVAKKIERPAEKSEDAPDAGQDTQPVAFAENLGPRRKFFWR